MTARLCLGAVTVLVLGVCACQTDVGTAGCQVTSEVKLPGTALTLLPDAKLVPTNGGFVLIGSDGAAIRWATVAANGVMGVEQMFPLPASLAPPLFALAGVAAPADTVLVGVVNPAANGVDAELQIIPVPADGSPPAAAGPPVATFVGGVPPAVVFGSSRPGRNAGVAWVDPVAGVVMFTTVDAQGALVRAPTTLPDTGSAFACLGIAEGTDDPNLAFPDDLTFSYLFYPSPGADPSWAKTEASETGVVQRTKRLTVAQPGGTMTCAVGTPPVPSSDDYSLVWQDLSGSWLSVDTAPPPPAPDYVMSFPFASATDFGGPDLQPPIVGLTAFGGRGTSPFNGDYGVLFARMHSVELWRVSSTGTRRSGALIFPSSEGNLGGVSATTVGGTMVASYADYASSAGASGRWLVNAACY